MTERRDLRELEDEALCALAASGGREAEEALVVRYNRLVRMCARPCFLAGGDSEDLIQEGMLGLLSAIREYDPGKSAAFRTYAEICIKNRLFSAVKAAARNKHTPLNCSVSIETPLYDRAGERYVPGPPGGQTGHGEAGSFLGFGHGSHFFSGHRLSAGIMDQRAADSFSVIFSCLQLGR